MAKAPKVAPPSKQYRTSAYTVREFARLPYAERMQVDAICNQQEAAKRAAAAGTEAQRGGVCMHRPTPPADKKPAGQSSTPPPNLQLTMLLTQNDFQDDLTTDEDIESDEPGFEPIDEAATLPAPAPAATAPTDAPPYAADLLTVVSEFVTMSEQGGASDWTHWGPSPFVDGGAVDFAVDTKRNVYKCFITRSTGGIVAFVMALKKLSYPQAIEWLSTNFPLPSEPDDEAPAADATDSEMSDFTEAAPTAAPGTAVEGATYQTSDYSIFHLLPENRPVDMGHVRKLVAMITKSNLLHVKPLDVTATMGVIDGQHRLAAARQLGLPIYYKIGQQLSQADITTLNVAQKNWAGSDYLHYWAVKGKTDYAALTAFMKRHPKLSFSNAKMMLGVTTKSNAEEFRTGQWKAGEAYKAEQVADFIERVSVEVPTFKQPNHSGFVAYVFHCVCEVERFSTKTCLERILKTPLMLVPCASHKQFAQMFDAFYNYRVNAEHRIHFT